MRWKWEEVTTNMLIRALLLYTLLATCVCEGTRRQAQRRKDVSELYLPSRRPESLQALAQAMGAAGFESYTEGKALVKRLIPVDNQQDLDLVEHQGVIGKAGEDFPAFPSIPNTGFNCKNVPTGYYADLETDCQVFHICDTSRKISFLCPNGTIFSQSHLICDWWFKVDCASAPALYESSAEYYSNEQKKAPKITHSLSKNTDIQQVGADSNIRPETKKPPINIPSTTERLIKHRQRLQGDLSNVKATSRSFHAIFAESTYNPTQRPQPVEKRRKNLVQLIANNFGNSPTRTTLPTYTDASTYRTTAAAGDYNSIKETQVAAESASFANNNNRQYLQNYNSNSSRLYPVYTPNLPPRSIKPKSNPTLTTLYDIRDKHVNHVALDSTTKRSTLVPYTKSYVNTYNERREPYTRPGVSLLKDYLKKERSKAVTPPTEFADVTDRNDFQDYNKVTIQTRNTFESATKIPQTTRIDYLNDTASSDRYDVYSNAKHFIQATTEPSYQERRERLLRKMTLESFGPTEPTQTTTVTDKYYGDLPNRPGLVVPPSLTPKTLHTLAIYYATALDNLSTTQQPEDVETTTASFDEYIEDGLPALFSRHTINKYSHLFGQGVDHSELNEEIKLDPNGTYNELVDDLTVQQSQNPIATSPQIRELAQVFTHALSAYLQDPVQFRKVLSDIRPTHPSFGDMLTTTEVSNVEPTTTVNEDDDEILGFSEDNKARPALASLRDRKSLNIATANPTVSDEPVTSFSSVSTEYYSPTTPRSTTAWSPFRCCGKISASYTTASNPSTTVPPFTNTVAANVNTLANAYSSTLNTSTELNDQVKERLQDNTTSNNSPYGKGVNPGAKPLNEYIEVTNLPSAWGIDASDTTAGQVNSFESERIRTTTALPISTAVYFTETDNVEFENEEELQRAHSQSFLTPSSNSLRQGKTINLDRSRTTVKKPSDELEAPTVPDSNSAPTTVQPTTTPKTDTIEALTTVSVSSSSITSPDGDATTYQFQWPKTFENWQSTVIDPITLNDNLSPIEPEQGDQLRQTSTWSPYTATTPSTDYTETIEPVTSSSYKFIEITTPGNTQEDRFGRLLRESVSTIPTQELSAITDTVVEKAKEIMSGMNATTTEKLMNVMKKTKSKTVRRLILLLVQTCDDNEHNTTAEASKKALLEALMAVSQKDMDEIAREEKSIDTAINDSISSTTKATDPHGRTSRVAERVESDSRLSENLQTYNPTPDSVTSSDIVNTASTTYIPKTTAAVSRRGAKKFLARSSPADSLGTRLSSTEGPIAEARIAPQGTDNKIAADTRALELLRSLYTIAARWG